MPIVPLLAQSSLAAPQAVAAEPAFRLDLSQNLILGDVGEGPLLQTLAKHAGRLDACLAGAEATFDRLGRVPSLDVRVTASGAVEEFGFRAEELRGVNECLARVLADIELPSADGDRFGILNLRSVGKGAPAPGKALRVEADGLVLVLTAQAVPLAGGWTLEAAVEAVPTGASRGIGADALVALPTLYRPDGSSTHTGSWSIGDQNPAPCVQVGEPRRLQASAGSLDVAGPGSVLRATVVLTHGTCADAMQTRTVVGAIELRVPATGSRAPTPTLWTQSQLEATQEPFEDVRRKARGF
jgi:hypothetical protein